MSLSGEQAVFGLDIGESCVKIVQLRKANVGYEVVAAARTEIQSQETDDETQKKQNIIGTIRKSLKSAHIHSKYAVCGICGPDVAVRSFYFSSLLKGDVQNAVMLEAEQVCPFEVDNCVVDYQVIEDVEMKGVTQEAQISMEDDSTFGILAAATNEVITRRKQLVKDASLRCVFLDINGLALLNCFFEYEKIPTRHAIAILDIGSSFTNLAVIRKDGLPFIRDMSYAGDNIISYIAEDLQMPFNVIRDVLIGRQEDNKEKGDISESLKKASAKLVVNITQTLRYYMVHESIHVDKIYVCGGFAQVGGLVELLNSQLPSMVELWNPFGKIRCKSDAHGKDIFAEHGHQMVVAVGLAMRML